MKAQPLRANVHILVAKDTSLATSTNQSKNTIFYVDK